MDEEEPEVVKKWNQIQSEYKRIGDRLKNEIIKKNEYLNTDQRVTSQVDDYFSRKLIFIPEDVKEYCLGINEYPDRKGRMTQRRIEFKEGRIM